jgi:hypothetical protein
MHGACALIKEVTENCIVLSAMALSIIQAVGPHQTPNESVGTLLLDLPASGTVRNKFLFSKVTWFMVFSYSGSN